MESFDQFMATGVIPDFPEKGRYRVYSHSWNPTGYADEPQYAGQLPTRFPPEWTPFQCFIAARRD
jgi:hypothetical protein